MNHYLYTPLSQGSSRNDIPILNDDDQCLLKCIARQDFIVLVEILLSTICIQGNIYFISHSISTSILISMKREIDSCVGKEYL